MGFKSGRLFRLEGTFKLCIPRRFQPGWFTRGRLEFLTGDLQPFAASVPMDAGQLVVGGLDYYLGVAQANNATEVMSYYEKKVKKLI